MADGFASPAFVPSESCNAAAPQAEKAFPHVTDGPANSSCSIEHITQMPGPSTPSSGPNCLEPSTAALSHTATSAHDQHSLDQGAGSAQLQHMQVREPLICW